MNSQELRIGNWIIENLIDEPRFIQVEKIVKDDDWSDCSPIPLTSDILLKAGFEDNSYAVFSKKFNGNEYLSIYFKDYAHTELREHPDVSDYSLPVKCIYLHTLQNLWFALTGAELNIQL